MDEPAQNQAGAHHFEAVGAAPFIKFPMGAIAGWRASNAMVIEAKGGLLHAADSIYTLGKGTFRIVPAGACDVSATFFQPVYFLSYRRFLEVLRDRYVFTVELRPNWRINLWPYLFAHFIRSGKWPDRAQDFVRFFRHILKEGDIAALSRSNAQTRLQRIRNTISITAMLRIGRNRSALILAKEHAEKIIQRFVEADFYSEMLAEMDTFSSLKRRGGVIPLLGEHAQDEIRLKVPFQIGVADKLTVEGRCTVEFMWEYSEFFGSNIACGFVELTPAIPVALPNRLKVYTAKTHIPLDSGHKAAYGVTFAAPLICKGEDATLHISNGLANGFSRLREEAENLLSPQSPRRKAGDLCVQVSATES
jgi:hypothetical protein